MSGTAAVLAPDGRVPTRPPAWLIGVTGVFALGVLAMAVAETNLWLHYLIDAGEPISLAGLVFAALAGLLLYWRGQIRASLPLMLPWLLFPVITQGDQIIDNLSINWMRFIVHLLLGLIFGIPVAVIVAGVRAVVANHTGRRRSAGWLALVPGASLLAAGRVREGTAVLATVLLTVMIGVAAIFLGLLMIATLVAMIWATLVWGFWPSMPVESIRLTNTAGAEKRAFIVLLVGVVASFGLYVGYKNRPGAYQGSPSYYMDPTQRDAGFRLDPLPMARTAASRPDDPALIREALLAYGRGFSRLLDGYYVLDRNYNYDFHNRLFLRSTPLLPDYRRVGLEAIGEATALRASADQLAGRARQTLSQDDALGSLLDDVRSYAAFTFARTSVLERMSAEFVRTEAGLQHATHLYEGEGKVLGVRLAEILEKYKGVLSSDAAAPITADFVAASRSVHDRYATRIVGF